MSASQSDGTPAASPPSSSSGSSSTDAYQQQDMPSILPPSRRAVVVKQLAQDPLHSDGGERSRRRDREEGGGAVMDSRSAREGANNASASSLPAASLSWVINRRLTTSHEAIEAPADPSASRTAETSAVRSPFLVPVDPPSEGGSTSSSNIGSNSNSNSSSAMAGSPRVNAAPAITAAASPAEDAKNQSEATIAAVAQPLLTPPSAEQRNAATYAASSVHLSSAVSFQQPQSRDQLRDPPQGQPQQQQQQSAPPAVHIASPTLLRVSSSSSFESSPAAPPAAHHRHGGRAEGPEATINHTDLPPSLQTPHVAPAPTSSQPGGNSAALLSSSHPSVVSPWLYRIPTTTSSVSDAPDVTGSSSRVPHSASPSRDASANAVAPYPAKGHPSPPNDNNKSNSGSGSNRDEAERTASSLLRHRWGDSLAQQQQQQQSQIGAASPAATAASLPSASSSAVGHSATAASAPPPDDSTVSGSRTSERVSSTHDSRVSHVASLVLSPTHQPQSYPAVLVTASPTLAVPVAFHPNTQASPLHPLAVPPIAFVDSGPRTNSNSTSSASNNTYTPSLSASMQDTIPPSGAASPGNSHTIPTSTTSPASSGTVAPALSSVACLPTPLSTHVHFSSEVDIVEASSRASTVVSNGVADATHAYTAVPGNNSGAAYNASGYDIDVQDEDDGSSSDDSPRRRRRQQQGERQSTSRSGHEGTGGDKSRDESSLARRAGSADREDGSVHVDVQIIPSVLTPDELQMARLKAYDRVMRHGSKAESSHYEREELRRLDNAPLAHNADNHDGSSATTLPPHGGVGSPCNNSSNNNHDSGDSDITTLDFLKDTTNTILPDAFTSMFASTTRFLRLKTDAVVHAMPPGFRHAMSATGVGIASAADLTGSFLSNMSLYAMRTVPDKVMSPQWKYLVFVDAINVLKGSLNVNVLVAPYIFRMAGLVGGVLIILVMEALCCYYTEVFFEAKNQLKSAGDVIMYGDVPRLTFGRWYPTYQIWYEGIELVAIVAYAALNMQALLPHMGIPDRAATALSFIIPSLFSLPFVFMKRARSQAPMMTIASLLVFVSLVMMFTAFPYGSVARATIGSFEHDSAVAVLHLFPQAAQEFFVALSICVFVFTPLSRRAVPVERTMAPQRYIQLLRCSVLISTAVYITFGVCAIVSYGSLTCSVLPSSFNGHHTRVEVAVMSLLFFAFLFYIPLSMFELGELCDRLALGWRTIPRYGETGPNFLRTLFLVASAFVAWCIPYYGLLIALCGSLGYSVVAIVLPAALDYVCRTRVGLRGGRTLNFLEYVITFSGFAFGLVVLVVGVVMTSYEMWLVVQSGYASTC